MTEEGTTKSLHSDIPCEVIDHRKSFEHANFIMWEASILRHQQNPHFTELMDDMGATWKIHIRFKFLSDYLAGGGFHLS